MCLPETPRTSKKCTSPTWTTRAPCQLARLLRRAAAPAGDRGNPGKSGAAAARPSGTTNSTRPPGVSLQNRCLNEDVAKKVLAGKTAGVERGTGWLWPDHIGEWLTVSRSQIASRCPVFAIFQTKRALIHQHVPVKAVKWWAGFSVSLTVSTPLDRTARPLPQGSSLGLTIEWGI